MKVTEFCERMGITRATAFKILKEDVDREKLAGVWYITTHGQSLLEKFTPKFTQQIELTPASQFKNDYIQEANNFLDDEESTNINGSTKNILVNNLQVILNRLLELNKLSRNNEKISKDVAIIFRECETIEDIINEIDTYIRIELL